MTNQSRYSYTTSWAVGRRFRSHRRIAPMSRRCAGANVAISVRNWASADRRATADWVLPGTSTSTCTERRPEASFFTLMLSPWDRISAAEGAPRPPGDARGRHGARGLVRCNRILGGATPPTLLGRCRTNDHRPATGARERHAIVSDRLLDQARDLRTSECGRALQVNPAR